MKGVLGAWLLSSLIFTCLQAGAASVSVGEAWVGTARRDGTEPLAFVTLVNAGDAPATLVGVETAAASRVDLARTVPTEGGTTIRAVSAIAVSPHATLVMSTETVFLTLVGLQRDLVEGSTVEATLRFADGTRLPVSFQVRAPVMDTGN